MPLIALVALALARPAITFNPPIAALPVIVGQLAKQSGLKLHVGKNVEEEILAIINPTGTPAQMMDQIAFAVEADWRQSGDDYFLARSPSQLKEQRERHLDIRSKIIQSALDKLPPETPWSESEAKAVAQKVIDFGIANQNATSVTMDSIEPISKRLPARRLAVRLLKALGARFLADQPLNTRMVLATDPHKSQLPLSAACLREVRQMVKESNYLVGILPPSNDLRFFNGMHPLSDRDRILVSLRIDSNGLEMDVQPYYMPGGTMGATGILRIDAFSPSVPLENPPDETLIEMSPISKAMIQAYERLRQGVAAQLSPEFQNYLRHPEANDPNAILNREALSALSRASGKPIIAALSDSMTHAYSLAIKGQLKLARYEKALNRRLKGEEHLGWQTFRPSDPESARLTRIDRTYLDSLGRAADKGPITLDVWAKAVLACPRKPELTSVETLFRLAEINIPSTGGNRNLDGLRFYGLLSDRQKNALRKGGILSVTDLSAEEDAVMTRMVYDRQWTTFEALPRDPDSIMTQIELEPTEKFPNGLSDPFQVSAWFAKGPVWFRETGWGPPRPTSENDSAYHEFERERPDLFPFSSDRQIEKPFHQGEQLTWRFRCTLNQIFAGGFSLSENRIGNGPALGLTDLPLTWQAEFAKQLAQIRESYKNAKPPNQGQTKPPF